MADYRIEEGESGIAVEVSHLGGQQDQLLEAFGECQQGRCACPTDEYQKLESLEVQHAGDVISLRLKARPGEKIDASQIAACLDYTTTQLGKADR